MQAALPFEFLPRTQDKQTDAPLDIEFEGQSAAAMTLGAANVIVMSSKPPATACICTTSASPNSFRSDPWGVITDSC